MGCDIHAYAEIEFGGTWHCYSKRDIKADYQLFGRMAGVRDASVEPIAAPRGLPRNPSAVAIFENEIMGVDAHTHSWLTCKEVADLEEWYRELRGRPEHINLFGYICGNGWDIAESPEEYPERLDGARLVFWFDC